MKKAQITDLLREMKKSFNRYISILAIMALGVAFYAGVRSSEPDMQLSVKKYFDELDLQDVDCIVQGQKMREQEREEFLQKFEREQDNSLIGFCVLGGVFSEGIDLTEERLIGAMIVGTGLPQVCNERELLKLYFDRQNENGFDYAYLYPGMNKVFQAAGRVIRTENDIGVVALLDERFRGLEYQKTFPREWKNIKYANQELIRETVSEFWESKDSSNKKDCHD